LFSRLRTAESVDRPLGDDRFLARIERLTKRQLRPGKRGPKPKLAAISALSPYFVTAIPVIP
jgi:putative transposase